MGIMPRKNTIRDVAQSMTVQLASLESSASTFSKKLKELIIDVSPKNINNASLELLRPKLSELKISQANVELSIKELEKALSDKSRWN